MANANVILANAKQHPMAELFENYSHSSSASSSRYNRKNKQNKKCVCIHEIIYD